MRMRSVLLLALLALVTVVAAERPGAAQAPVAYPDPAQRVLTHREQNELVTPWIRKRFDTVLPGLMTREGVDMWIIPTREYNEDPVFASMSPITYFASRRRTILVFYNPGGGRPVERYSIGRFDYDKRCASWSRRRTRRRSASTSPMRGTTPTGSPPTRSAGCSTRSARRMRAV